MMGEGHLYSKHKGQMLCSCLASTRLDGRGTAAMSGEEQDKQMRGVLEVGRISNDGQQATNGGEAV